MDGQEGLAERFEPHRGRLRAVAFRMLGSGDDADDAVQEVWLRLSRTDTSDVANLAGWLTTVLSRICLDMLRTRTARREDLVGARLPDRWDGAPGGAGEGPGAGRPRPGTDPEHEALLTDSVGRALLVVLDTLTSAERVAFVLHDLFAVPFQQLAPIVERTPVATKKLASRARHKVRGTPAVDAAELARHRHVVEAFLAAARTGDLSALLAVLAPDVVRRADPAALPPGAPTTVRGARAVAETTLVFGRGSRRAVPALVDGHVGIVVAPHGRLRLAIVVTVRDDRVAAYEVIADPARLCQLDLAVLDPWPLPGPDAGRA
ncbi:sigma-70 family RNA polymerase sigma factor [Streptomyces sp. NPDC057702]|uniref:sigma-70 family RNA polymerase sigma factor n=1 Tax=unclassified Streptomyces TaxID=2593676 RepID=UPI0036AA4BB4